MRRRRLRLILISILSFTGGTLTLRVHLPISRTCSAVGNDAFERNNVSVRRLAMSFQLNGQKKSDMYRIFYEQPPQKSLKEVKRQQHSLQRSTHHAIPKESSNNPAISSIMQFVSSTFAKEEELVYEYDDDRRRGGRIQPQQQPLPRARGSSASAAASLESEDAGAELQMSSTALTFVGLLALTSVAAGLVMKGPMDDIMDSAKEALKTIQSQDTLQGVGEAREAAGEARAAKIMFFNEWKEVSEVGQRMLEAALPSSIPDAAVSALCESFAGLVSSAGVYLASVIPALVRLYSSRFAAKIRSSAYNPNANARSGGVDPAAAESAGELSMDSPEFSEAVARVDYIYASTGLATVFEGIGMSTGMSSAAGVLLAQVPYQLIKLRAKAEQKEAEGKTVQRPKALKPVRKELGLGTLGAGAVGLRDDKAEGAAAPAGTGLGLGIGNFGWSFGGLGGNSGSVVGSSSNGGGGGGGGGASTAVNGATLAGGGRASSSSSSKGSSSVLTTATAKRFGAAQRGGGGGLGLGGGGYTKGVSKLSEGKSKLAEALAGFDYVEVMTDTIKWLEYDVIVQDFTKGYGGSRMMDGWTAAGFGMIACISSLVYRDITVVTTGYGGPEQRQALAKRSPMDWLTSYGSQAFSSAAFFGLYQTLRNPTRNLAMGFMSGVIQNCIGSDNFHMCSDAYVTEQLGSAAADAATAATNML